MLSEVTACDFCGCEWREGDPSNEWLSLEVARGDGSVDWDWTQADFCSQSHAAQWLQRPLPSLPPRPESIQTWGNRGSDFLMFVALMGIGTLLLLGLFTFFRLLGGWF